MENLKQTQNITEFTFEYVNLSEPSLNEIVQFLANHGFEVKHSTYVKLIPEIEDRYAAVYYKYRHVEVLLFDFEKDAIQFIESPDDLCPIGVYDSHSNRLVKNSSNFSDNEAIELCLNALNNNV